MTAPRSQPTFPGEPEHKRKKHLKKLRKSIALNSRLAGIAEIVELSLDTEQRCVRAVLRLCGDRDTIDVHVRDYRLRKNKDAPEIEIAAITASREWLQNALQKFVVGRWVAIPAAAKTALQSLT